MRRRRGPKTSAPPQGEPRQQGRRSTTFAVKLGFRHDFEPQSASASTCNLASSNSRPTDWISFHVDMIRRVQCRNLSFQGGPAVSAARARAPARAPELP